MKNKKGLILAGVALAGIIAYVAYANKNKSESKSSFSSACGCGA